MRLIKVLGLAVFAAMAAMAFVGVSSASAVDEIVLCLKLVTGEELCPKGQLLPKGTEILSLAENTKLETSIGTEECEDSIATAKTSAEAGSPLSLEDGLAVFGKLPTPKLGEGCTGPCDEGIHPLQLENVQIEVEAVDKFFLKAEGLAFLLHCDITFLHITCAYRGADKSVIDRDNLTHKSMEGKFDSVLVETDLTRVTAHGGSSFCPATTHWIAKYTIDECHTPTGEHKLCWVALGEEEPGKDEVVVCKKLVSKSALCPSEEYYPSGTKLLALAANTEFKASPFNPVKCEDSQIEAETTAAMGETLGIKITKLEFGKLPTPKLGEGCSICPEGIHTPTAITGSVEVGAEDKFLLKSSGAKELLGCFGLGATCVYGAEGLKSTIDNDAGTHNLASEEKGLASILVSAKLFFIKGSNFCPEEGTWTANYVVYAVESSGKQGQGWLALYKKL